MEARNAAKAFIVHEGKILLLKRRENDVHAPSVWEVPGGRLELGENPFEGLKREVKEETGLEISIVCPFHISHFQRDDGQTITMLEFLCKAKSNSVVIGEEHTEFEWVPLGKAKEKISKYFWEEIDELKKFRLLEKI